VVHDYEDFDILKLIVLSGLWVDEYLVELGRVPHSAQMFKNFDLPYYFLSVVIR